MKAKMFVTLLYCVLDFQTGNLRYSRAGHLPPILVTRDGKIIDIPVNRGEALGVFENLELDEQKLTIPKGGLALFFSDGLYEAIDSDENAFGIDRVNEILIANRHETAKDICKRLWSAVQEFSGEVPHQDDFTAVIIKRT
jgi:sigma-B regulation protein RsbU (phosphoserine phosphatase)